MMIILDIVMVSYLHEYWKSLSCKEVVLVTFSNKGKSRTRPPTAQAATLAASASAVAAWHSKRYNCELTYFSPDSIVVFLEEDGLFKKLLTSEGLIGWTWFDENYNHCFEEMKAKS